MRRNAEEEAAETVQLLVPLQHLRILDFLAVKTLHRSGLLPLISPACDEAYRSGGWGEAQFTLPPLLECFSHPPSSLYTPATMLSALHLPSHSVLMMPSDRYHCFTTPFCRELTGGERKHQGSETLRHVPHQKVTSLRAEPSPRGSLIK